MLLLTPHQVMVPAQSHTHMHESGFTITAHLSPDIRSMQGCTSFWTRKSLRGVMCRNGRFWHRFIIGMEDFFFFCLDCISRGESLKKC